MQRFRNMQRLIALAGFVFVITAFAQRGGERTDPFDRPDGKLPNGKSQKDEIVKADHKSNQQDSATLALLAVELREELATQESGVISVKMLKKLDEIERLTRNIRGRLKRN